MRFPIQNLLTPGAVALGMVFSSGAALAAADAEMTVAQAAPQQQQQQPQQQQPPQQQQAPATPVSDDEIDQFISAANEIQVLHEDAQKKLSEAGDETQAAAMREETERSMHSAIEESGLTIQRYQEIFVAYQSDPEVNEKVAEKMAE